MTIIAVSTLSDFAQLSLASYALFEQDLDQQKILQQTASMTETQAADFLEKYRIVHQAPNDSVGFSAAIFQEKISLVGRVKPASSTIIFMGNDPR